MNRSKLYLVGAFSYLLAGIAFIAAAAFQDETVPKIFSVSLLF